MANHRVTITFNPAHKPYLTQVAAGIFRRYREGLPVEFDMALPWWEPGFRSRTYVVFERCQGLIAGVRESSMELLAGNPKPMVTVGPEGLHLDRHWVGPDYEKIAENVCGFFYSRGFRHLIYVHSDLFTLPHSFILRDTVISHCERLSMECRIYYSEESKLHEHGYDAFEEIDDFVQILKSIPKPCAFFAPDDHYSWRATLACEQAGLRIPEDVSVLGVRSDDFLCEFSTPTLSHVYIDYTEIGRQAAETIWRLLEGEEFPQRIYAGGGQIRERGSTLSTAHTDPVIEKAVAFMEKHLHEKISQEQIASAAHVSKRTLLRRFNEILNNPPTEILRQHRLERAKQLLSNSNMPLVEVALRCGFCDQPQLNRVIKQETGKTPTDYRREHAV